MELIDVKQEIDYRKENAINQSSLKELAKGPKAYMDAINKELDEGLTPIYFEFGSAVDCLLTTPDNFDLEYAVMDIDKPSDNITLIMNNVLKSMVQESQDPRKAILTDWSEIIVSIAHSVGYGKNWKPETVSNKVITEGRDYFEFMAASEGKNIISRSTYQNIERCVEMLMTDEHTSKIINADGQHQVGVYWKDADTGMQCKGLLDKIIIDENTKTIYPYDLKTTGDSVNYFPSSVIKFRYDFQGAFYTDGLKATYEPKGYTVAPFRFIVAERNNNNRPMVFELTDRDLELGRNGGILPSGRKLKGYKELLDELKWHQESGIWEYSKEYFTNGGIKLIDIMNED